MVYTQTVEIPADRKLYLKLPETAPAGKTVRVECFVEEAPETAALRETGPEPSKTPITDWLSGLLSGLPDRDAKEIREMRLRERYGE